MQESAQITAVNNGSVVRQAVSGQVGTAGLVFAQKHHGIFDLRMLPQGVFDFSQFNAKSAQLDLRIHAAQKFQHAVGTPAHQVAGFVHARA